MKCSEEGLELIRKFEGCKLAAYPDPGTGGDPWTIGIGHTHGVKPGDTCTEGQAMDWLRVDIGTAERCVNQSVRGVLTQNQYDALCSFVFNLGCGALRNSNLLRCINQGNDVQAATEFLKWDHAGGHVMAGLTKRRQAESELFMA